MNEINIVDIRKFLETSFLRLTGTKTGYPSIDRTHEKGVSFLKKHPIIPNLSIYNSLCLLSSLYKEANALNCFDLNVTYSELLDNAKVLSKSFKELGVKKNDIITMSLPNYTQAVASFLAANRIGAVTTFLNPGSSIEEVKHYLNLFESPIYMNFNKDFEYNQGIKKDTKVQKIITVHPQDLVTGKFSDKSSQTYEDYLNYRDLKIIADAYKKPIHTFYGKKQDALILFTSGSTGNPKSVVLTNENILSSGTYLKNSSNIKSEVGEKTLVCVPFCYPYGFATSTLMSLLCGREAILAPDIGPKTIDYYMLKGANMIFGSPALLQMIRKHTSPNIDLSETDVFISGGDFLGTQQITEGQKFFESHNADVLICNGSGNAETGGSGTNPVGVDYRPDTAGKVLAGTHPIIIDSDTGEELKYGEEGQLCISGKNVFKEYYGESQLTENSKFQYKGKTYFKTGTRGILDEDGYFTLTGRDSRFYITSTLNKVYCDHIQAVICNIKGIEDCAVVKTPDEDALFVNTAFIVLEKDYMPTEETKEYLFAQFCSPVINQQTNETLQLKDYEHPQNIEFVEELPRIRADKIDYEKLEKIAKSNVAQKVKKR